MILFTGFEAISDSKLTSDVNWGCMVRSSQMLVAQVTFICLDQSLFTTAAVNFDTLTVSSFEKKKCRHSFFTILEGLGGNP
jgi:hypothetical protein